MPHRKLIYIFFVLCLGFILSYPLIYANDNETKEIVSIRGEYKNNLYASGGFVDAVFNSTDDVFMSGGEINYRGQTKKNAFLAGGSIRVIDATALLSAIAGGTLYLSQVNFEELVIAGGNIHLENGVINDDLVAAGGNIILGPNFLVKDSVRMAGGSVVIEGHIAGDVQVYAGELQIKPTAIIDGNLSYRADEVSIDPNAKISGKKIILPELEDELGTGAKIFSIFVFLMMSLGALMIPSLISLVFKQTTVTACKEISKNIWPVIGKGVVIALIAPLLLVALFISIIGIPFGLVLIPFLIIAHILICSIIAFTTGHLLHTRIYKLSFDTIPRNAGIFGWTLIGTIVIMIILFIPLLGFLFYLFATFLGTGALYQTILLQIKSRSTSSETIR